MGTFERSRREPVRHSEHGTAEELEGNIGAFEFFLFPNVRNGD